MRIEDLIAIGNANPVHKEKYVFNLGKTEASTSDVFTPTPAAQREDKNKKPSTSKEGVQKVNINTTDTVSVEAFIHKDATADLSTILMTSMKSVMYAHENSPKTPKNRVRGHDGVTPYWVHPVLGAMMILEDSQGIPDISTRAWAANLFLCHDLVEDTSVDTIDQKFNLSREDNDLLTHWLSCDGGSKKEYEFLSKNVDKVPDVVWYIKTVDKFINLTNDSFFTKRGTLNDYLKYLYFYASKAVECGYTNSFVVQQALLLIIHKSPKK